MKKNFYILSLIAILAIGTLINAQEVYQSPKLTKVWEVKTGLDVPESATFNPYDKTIYVSSIVGKFDVKDGVGYISKINLKGEIVQKEWVKGLNAPKGMSFTKSRLYITDMDRVLEIGVPSGKILKEYKNSHFKDLNDVAVAPNGKVYVTDSGSDCLFVVGKDSLEIFVQSPEIQGMNGICIENNNIYIGAGDKLLSIDANSKSITVIATNTGYVDGLIKINKNTFITSDWGGKIQLIVLGKSPEKLLESKINAADLGYIPAKGLLLVPTFTENTVVAYKLELKK
jgi:DNA-binding beta-propeller fold protein YncE